MAVTHSWCGGERGAWGILVHGGAGDVPAARREAHAAGCREAARRGAEILAAGGSSIDAAQAAVEILEDDPRFNAGTGASLDESGELRLDAAIMDGSSLALGAVCSLPAFRHPIAVAREVLRDGRHVLYAAEGAALFAERRGLVRADPASMITKAALARLEATRLGQSGNWAGGTVGAVARDASGHVAAATSTGGLVGKHAGRVGDSPIPGAGTYADDLAGAASGTGEGEGYLRTGVCLRACLWLQEGREPLDTAEEAIRMLRARVGSSGGIILAAPDGRLALARSTATMGWGACWASLSNLTSGVLPRHREIDEEGGSGGRLWIQRDVASVVPEDLGAEGQPQAGLGPRRRAPLERLKEQGALAFRDPWPLILDREQELFPLPGRGEAHGRVDRREPQRVVDDVLDGLRE